MPRTIVNPDDVYGALLKTGNNRNATAAIIGVSVLTIKKHISKGGERFEKFKQVATTERDLISALELSNGKHQDAAKILKIHPASVNRLVRNFDLTNKYPPDSRGRRTKPVAKEELIAILEKAAGDRRIVDEALDCSRSTTQKLIKKYKLETDYPPQSCLQQKTSKDKLIAALNKTGHNRTEAAKILGIVPTSLSRLITDYNLRERYSLENFTTKQLVDALIASGGSRKLAGNILGLPGSQVSRYIKKRKLKKFGPRPGGFLKVDRLALINALIETKGIKSRAKKLLNVGRRRLDTAIKENKLAGVPYTELKDLLSTKLFETGMVYSKGDRYYLSCSESSVITVIDGNLCLKGDQTMGGYIPEHDMEIGVVTRSWNITFKELDAIVEEYFPRPPARTKKNPKKKYERQAHCKH